MHTWQSPFARARQSGVLVILTLALISAGIMISSWVDYGFYFLTGFARWRGSTDISGPLHHTSPRLAALAHHAGPAQ
jgi:hypothetical protein